MSSGWICPQLRPLRCTGRLRRPTEHVCGCALSTPSACRSPSALLGIGVYPMLVSEDRVDVTYREPVSAVWDPVQPEPNWRLEFFGDEPGPVVVRESARSAMLVIGTREHVGFGRILAGRSALLPESRPLPDRRGAVGARRTEDRCRSGAVGRNPAGWKLTG